MHTAISEGRADTCASIIHAVTMTAATSIMERTLRTTTQDCKHTVWQGFVRYLAPHVPSPHAYSVLSAWPKFAAFLGPTLLGPRCPHLDGCPRLGDERVASSPGHPTCVLQRKYKREREGRHRESLSGMGKAQGDARERRRQRTRQRRRAARRRLESSGRGRGGGGAEAREERGEEEERGFKPRLAKLRVGQTSFRPHSTIATLLHSIDVEAMILNSCRIMICMHFARCVHSRTDIKSHHKHRVESYHAYTPFITPVRHRSKYPAEPPVPPRDMMFRVGTSVVTCHRRGNPRCP